MARLRGGPAKADASTDKRAKLEARIAELESALAERDRRAKAPGLTKAAGRSAEFTENKQQANDRHLEAELRRHKAALQEEPDAAKLRLKVVDQQTELVAMRRALKQMGKERDQALKQLARYQGRRGRALQDAEQLLTAKRFRVVVMALHSDRAEKVTAAELAEAERTFIATKAAWWR
jgi:hypothetical protein